MTILELHTLTSAQIDVFQALMYELTPEISVTPEMLERAANAPETNLFTAVVEDGHIIGCASPCLSLPYRSESEHRGCRGEIREPESGNLKGTDGAYHHVRSARTGSGGLESDVTAGKDCVE